MGTKKQALDSGRVMPGWLSVAQPQGLKTTIILITSHDSVGHEFGPSLSGRFCYMWHRQGYAAGARLVRRVHGGFIPVSGALRRWLEGWARGTVSGSPSCGPSSVSARGEPDVPHGGSEFPDKMFREVGAETASHLQHRVSHSSGQTSH